METLHKQIKKTLTEIFAAGRSTGIKKILLIDGNQDTVLLAALSEQGYDVIHCNSVRKAWSFVYPHPPHLIMIRLDDPSRAGLGDLHECRALAKDVPIILATSTQIDPSLAKAMRQRTAGILWLPATLKIKRKTLKDPRLAAMRR